jgi:hypothetical protein
LCHHALLTAEQSFQTFRKRDIYGAIRKWAGYREARAERESERGAILRKIMYANSETE